MKTPTHTFRGAYSAAFDVDEQWVSNDDDSLIVSIVEIKKSESYYYDGYDITYRDNKNVVRSNSLEGFQSMYHFIFDYDGYPEQDILYKVKLFDVSSLIKEAFADLVSVIDSDGKMETFTGTEEALTDMMIQYFGDTKNADHYFKWHAVKS